MASSSLARRVVSTHGGAASMIALRSALSRKASIALPLAPWVMCPVSPRPREIASTWRLGHSKTQSRSVWRRQARWNNGPNNSRQSRARRYFGKLFDTAIHLEKDHSVTSPVKRRCAPRKIRGVFWLRDLNLQTSPRRGLFATGLRAELKSSSGWRNSPCNRHALGYAAEKEGSAGRNYV